MEYQKESTEKWKGYHKNSLISKKRLKLNKIFLNQFQRTMYIEISKKVSFLLEKKNKVRILSAGSGIDFIAFKLKKRFRDRVSITIFDVSVECIEKNISLFGDGFDYIVGDIFNYMFRGKYDIAYNTGLLEHFLEKERKKIVSKLEKSLERPGFFITLNPSSGGKLYIKCMKDAMEKGKWPFGIEIPIKSLENLSGNGLELEKEFKCCASHQLTFLFYTKKLLFLAFLPVIAFMEFFYIRVIDNIFGRFIGQYSLVSIFRKQ